MISGFQMVYCTQAGSLYLLICQDILLTSIRPKNDLKVPKRKQNVFDLLANEVVIRVMLKTSFEVENVSFYPFQVF